MSSTGSVYVKSVAGQNQDLHYQAILATIVQKGTPNEQYAGDVDMTYGTLKEILAGRVPGLPALLKTLKKQKKVDYNDSGVMLKDDVVISVVGADDNKTTDFISYEDIIAKLGTEHSGQAKIGGW